MKEKLGFKTMNIKLSNKKNEQEKSFFEVVVLKTTEYLQKDEKEILDNIFFTKKSFNVYFNSLNNRLYISCLKLKSENIKTVFFKVMEFAKKTKINSIKIDIVQNNKELDISNIIEGLYFGVYEFNKYKLEKQKKENFDIYISIEKSKKDKNYFEEQLLKTINICKSINLTRDIVNTTPQDYYPQIMANDAEKIAQNENIECKIFGEEYLKQNKMNLMYGVGIASIHESKLIHLIYKPKKAKAKIVFIGKGVTYDTGGLSLKRNDGMVSMKCDKAGAASVLGLIDAISNLNLPFEVHGIIGAVENMIGGNAYKPDDVLKAMNGKTIEVTNTDAEGRLVLADCLTYAQKNIENIDYIFDLATLTGASIGAFGGYTTAVMGYSEKLKKKILKASKNSGELVGILPFNDYLEKLLDSQIADFKNSNSNKNGAAITASLFLSKFIEEKYKKKWLHFDIAGPSYREETWGYYSYGATGVAIRLIIEFLEDIK